MLAELYADSKPINGRVVETLVEIIKDPSHTDDTNAFASLLADVNDQRFIAPLIEQIEDGQPGGSPWLADYMYALIELLYSEDNFYAVSDSFVHLLGGWLLNTGGGEISWKSGDILAEIQNPESKRYVMIGAADNSLFHQTRIACIRAVVNQYTEEALSLLEGLMSDSDCEVRKACQSALNYLKQQNTQA
ncbi:hypothetical protein JIN77_02125 [Verrucomicrobiaceae bacterium R5-34]|uniref:HEAT repeat domain-containing protein n=1 Tax=Oceaniferula flava TaxID=2800421 RepID=A0AAE2V7G7_9BACT|nr:hypothetical protein [Oceaniferula flavus]MBK1829508.1 hypothetical protein [Verrucomicrobiaceae bacterium R5-34]MBK1853737.1 hypothetical protein [Oceaniferula flavus]MBM1135043.1 hypothetical protein [Oceaniferula flavus]